MDRDLFGLTVPPTLGEIVDYIDQPDGLKVKIDECEFATEVMNVGKYKRKGWSFAEIYLKDPAYFAYLLVSPIDVEIKEKCATFVRDLEGRGFAVSKKRKV